MPKKRSRLFLPKASPIVSDEASIPREYCVGRTAWLFGNKELAQTSLTAARAIFERMTREQPDYAQGWSYLGLTDAMLGRCDEAIQEGKRACEILPLPKIPGLGPIWITYLAAIYTWCGDKDAALEQLNNSQSNFQPALPMAN